MILCHCAAVTEATIVRLIAEGASTVEELSSRSGAGRRCAPCREELSSLLYAADLPSHNPAPTQTASSARP